MQKWAGRLMNYLHKFHLVEAEARVLGQLFEAEEFMNKRSQVLLSMSLFREEALLMN